jgi:hypothetical protein
MEIIKPEIERIVNFRGKKATFDLVKRDEITLEETIISLDLLERVPELKQFMIQLKTPVWKVLTKSLVKVLFQIFLMVFKFKNAKKENDVLLVLIAILEILMKKLQQEMK